MREWHGCAPVDDRHSLFGGSFAIAAAICMRSLVQGPRERIGARNNPA
jgi:hypothetical protein